jgi:hypothetical protein
MPAGTMDRAALAELEEQPAIPSACGEPRPGVCFKLAEGRIDLRRVDRTDQYLSRSCEVISDVYRRLAAGSGFRPIVDWRQVRFAFVALVGVASGALIDGTRPRKSGSHRTPRWSSHRTPRWRRESRANPSLEPKFPASWENTGNFIDSGLGDASTVAKNAIRSVPYGPIPCAS